MKQKHKQKETPPRTDLESPKMIRYPGTEESEKEMLKYAIMNASEALVKPQLLKKNEETGK
eukprot:scaffold15999_cov69-Cylindrotheca_fusiformis.AAC.1